MNTDKTKTSLAKFEEFFSTQYKNTVNDALENYPNKKSVVVDYLDLEMFDPDLADLLIEKPDEVILAAEKAIKNIDSQRKNVDINVRISNLTNEIDKLNSKYIGKFVSVLCNIKKIEKIRPRIVSATFECRGCLRLHEVIQTSNLRSEPSLCPECGGRSFRLLHDESEYVDTQQGIAELIYDNNPSSNKIPFIVEDDLAGTILTDKKVILTGILRVSQDKKQLSTYFYVNYCNPLEEDIEESLEEFTSEYETVDPTSRESPEYISWRDSVLSRDGHECQCCGLKKHLHAHHLYGYKEHPDLRLDKGNGITLCQFCHDKYHSVYGLTNINPANFAKFIRRFSNG